MSAEPRTYNTGVVLSRAVLPKPPGLWSYSSLKDVESCPRRFVLSHADYPDLWDKHGYPRSPIPAAIKGNVVHGSLEIIVQAMVKAGCPSTRSAEAVAVLRELGGYTAIAEQVLSAQLERFDGNPRVDAESRERLDRMLTEWLPKAREQIQTYLNRMELSGGATPKPKATVSDPETKSARYPARVGDHPEQELVAQDLRLTGRLDLLKVTADNAAIIDFKTGVEDEAHHDQLRLYALLWHLDSTVNPDAIPVTSLVAAYPTHEVAVAVPDAGELAAMAETTKGRIATADGLVAAESPEAVVGDQCGFCSVRVLCEAYWQRGAPNLAAAPDDAWLDLEGTVLREHGVKSWVVRDSDSGREVLVRTPAASVTLPLGKTVRILGARRTVDPDEEAALIASLTSTSEMYQMV